MFSFEPLPFKISEVDALGLKQVVGLLNVREKALVLEFKVVDSFVGIYSSDVRELTISVENLHKITCSKNLFTAKMIIHANSMKDLQDIPGAGQGTLTLKIAKKNYKLADNLCSAINVQISELKLERLNNT